MRRIAPWLPLAIVLATLVACTFRAMVRQQLSTEDVDGAVAWGLPYACFYLYAVPYFVPMLLLEGAKSLRRRSAAPPAVASVAVVLALPALTVATLWPLGVGMALLLGSTPIARTMLADHRLACAAVWGVSVAATMIWIVGAASRWLWWARPVAVEGAGPYR